MDSSTENNINISGFIKAERNPSPTILFAIKDSVHNSLQVIRLDRNQHSSITAENEMK